jgi:hypothetical protein
LAKISDSSETIRSQFIRLLDALKSYGPRNLTLISMVTGIPRETVRYKVKKQLRDLGFRINMIPNVYRMGLTRQFARLTFTREGLRIARNLMQQLGTDSYLTYYCKIAFKNEYLAILTPPQRYARLYREYFEDLAKVRIIQDFELHRVTEVGYPHVTYRLFDFERGMWSIPSEDHEDEPDGDVVLQRASSDEQANYLIDSIDLSIITELLNDAFTPMTRVSSAEGRDPRLLRYHFQEHIVRKGLIAGHVIGWYPTGIEYPSIARMWIEMKDMNSRVTKELFGKVISSPYCKFYQILDNHTYTVFLEIGNQFRTAIEYLSNKFAENSVEGQLVVVEDANGYAITKELFRENHGWIKPTLSQPLREGIPLKLL